MEADREAPGLWGPLPVVLCIPGPASVISLAPGCRGGMVSGMRALKAFLPHGRIRAALLTKWYLRLFYFRRTTRTSHHQNPERCRGSYHSPALAPSPVTFEEDSCVLMKDSELSQIHKGNECSSADVPAVVSSVQKVNTFLVTNICERPGSRLSLHQLLKTFHRLSHWEEQHCDNPPWSLDCHSHSPAFGCNLVSP